MSNHKYSDNFKREAVQRFVDCGSVSKVCDHLGIQPASLRIWIKEFENHGKADDNSKACTS